MRLAELAKVFPIPDVDLLWPDASALAKSDDDAVVAGALQVLFYSFLWELKQVAAAPGKKAQATAAAVAVAHRDALVEHLSARLDSGKRRSQRQVRD